MNERVHKLLLAREKFMHKMHLRHPTALGKPRFMFIAVDHLLKAKKEYRNSKKQESQNKFIKTN